MKSTLQVLMISTTVLCGALLTGCGSSGGGNGGTTPSGALASGGATDIYVIQHEPDSANYTILDFAVDSSATATPKGVLNVPPSFSPISLATDITGQIYLGGILTTNNGLSASGEILVYAAGATGSATPFKTMILANISGAFVSPDAMTVDFAGSIYVTGPFEGVEVYAPGVDGISAATPTRLLTSAQLQHPYDVAVDAAGEIFVTNNVTQVASNGYAGPEILVFAAGANGNDAPVRVITGPAATSTTQNSYFGISADSAGDIYTVFNTTTYNASNTVTGTSSVVQEFAAEASGGAMPVKTISGTATGLAYSMAQRLDTVGNLYLLNNFPGTETASTYFVLGFGPQAKGDIAPGLQLASAYLTDVVSIALK